MFASLANLMTLAIVLGACLSLPVLLLPVALLYIAYYTIALPLLVVFFVFWQRVAGPGSPVERRLGHVKALVDELFGIVMLVLFTAVCNSLALLHVFKEWQPRRDIKQWLAKVLNVGAVKSDTYILPVVLY